MTKGIDYVYVETHNWGKTVKFWQELGFTLELDLGTSGRLVHPEGGAALYVEEISSDRTPGMSLYLETGNAGAQPNSPVEITKDWHPSHWGTELLEVGDPDGRTVTIQYKGE